MPEPTDYVLFAIVGGIALAAGLFLGYVLFYSSSTQTSASPSQQRLFNDETWTWRDRQGRLRSMKISREVHT